MGDLDFHIGRHWPNAYEPGPGKEQTFEEMCPCPTEPCGLVALDKADPDCPHHAFSAAKTMRTSHRAVDCPGAPDA